MATTAHRIRLRGYWLVSPLGDGRTRHRRSFGRPRVLERDERAWLICDELPGPATVSLNGVAIGSAEPGHPFAADITDLLHPRNEAAFDVAAAPAAPLGEVALEIRRG